MLSAAKEINYYPSLSIPPNVNGDVRYVLSVKITDFCLEEEMESSNYIVQLKLWGSTSPIPIPISSKENVVGMNESTLLSVRCSLEQLNNYLHDSQYMYFEVIDFDILQLKGFGSIETAHLDSLKACEPVKEHIFLYSSETGFRIAHCNCFITLLPYKTANNRI